MQMEVAKCKTQNAQEVNEMERRESASFKKKKKNGPKAKSSRGSKKHRQNG
jgi:hypothetical protein